MWDWLQSHKGDAFVTLPGRHRHARRSGRPATTHVRGKSASPLRARPAATSSFALWTTDGVANVANCVNQRRFTQLFPEATNEHFDQLGIVLVRVLPHAFAELRARKDAARFAH